jgi:hypothetical protein
LDADAALPAHERFSWDTNAEASSSGANTEIGHVLSVIPKIFSGRGQSQTSESDAASVKLARLLLRVSKDQRRQV